MTFLVMASSHGETLFSPYGEDERTIYNTDCFDKVPACALGTKNCVVMDRYFFKKDQ